MQISRFRSLNMRRTWDKRGLQTVRNEASDYFVYVQAHGSCRSSLSPCIALLALDASARLSYGRLLVNKGLLCRCLCANICIWYYNVQFFWSYFVTIGLQFYMCFMSPPFEEWWRGSKCYPCPCVRASVRPLSKVGVRSITVERLHRFNSNLVCWYVISKHRSSSIWVTIH